MVLIPRARMTAEINTEGIMYQETRLLEIQDLAKCWRSWKHGERGYEGLIGQCIYVLEELKWNEDNEYKVELGVIWIEIWWGKEVKEYDWG